jgi:hypothetical protein
MALWRDGKWVLVVGPSGLQYRPTVSSSFALAETKAIVRRFFEERRAVIDAASTDAILVFTRGRRWIGRLSWLLFLPEKWVFHKIAISFEVHGEAVILAVDYDAWFFFTVIVPPNQFEREIGELRAALAGPIVA